MRLRTLLRPTGLVAAGLVLFAAAPAVASAATGPGPGVGWIRVGHLSPGVPPVDIYFAPFGQPEKVVIRKAGYGAVTPYSSLDPGQYTLSMRPADAAASTPPALSATISVEAQNAYSLLVFENGPDQTLKGTLVTDDLTAPSAGNGRVRVVEGSATPAPVSVDGPAGLSLAANAAYGDTTPYAEVPQGSVPLQLTSGSVKASADVAVAPGSSTTVLVTQDNGTLKATPISDGADLPNPPKLGVETGGGGTALNAIRSEPWFAGGVGVFLLALVLVPLVRRIREGRAR
ncbi:DUF4397 domain-containing protein [Amycolatopsis rhabdoformis]|uniref:DUF4397 domain-containing protein n=1 Tax=Amycolatopsis rhabdoformis TaxID=1448059 RepID=A0ABZ1IGE2_9PSEU|nr:DUF4397 domain-containing protein [Amycolatopsis rhabdoformis]WSE33178.1 DUF4397 domain-containing protein [Amycolatopsis rhabdoformis]